MSAFELLIAKIAVLTAFALALMFLNLKAGASWLKWLSLWAMTASFVGAGWFVVRLVTA